MQSYVYVSTAQGQMIFIGMLAVLAIVGLVAIIFSTVRGRRRAAVAKQGPNHKSHPAPTDPWRRFTTALSAPYGRVESKANSGSNKLTPEQYYFGYAVAGGLLGPVMPLRRDWGVKDANTAWQVVGSELEHLKAGLGSPDRNALAFDIGRIANLVRWSAAAMYLTPAEADQALDEIGSVAASSFSGWDDYGRAFAQGAKESKFRTRPHEKAADWLVTDPNSPWRQQPWPQRM